VAVQGASQAESPPPEAVQAESPPPPEAVRAEPEVGQPSLEATESLPQEAKPALEAAEPLPEKAEHVSATPATAPGVSEVVEPAAPSPDEAAAVPITPPAPDLGVDGSGIDWAFEEHDEEHEEQARNDVASLQEADASEPPGAEPAAPTHGDVPVMDERGPETPENPPPQTWSW
jgi:hypothetical protein